ncbi:twin transmembrane helix small protein [Azospirillum sp.]|uniref:twin transmembrane helix small protein n=1 Tax=Azospirillum sp. TaxID=34012 RepID=UPI003D755830
MSGFFLILMGLAMAALLASLFAGLFFMARGGESDRRNSNRMMRLRVGLQGLAIVLFILALITQAA